MRLFISPASPKVSPTSLRRTSRRSAMVRRWTRSFLTPLVLRPRFFSSSRSCGTLSFVGTTPWEPLDAPPPLAAAAGSPSAAAAAETASPFVPPENSPSSVRARLAAGAGAEVGPEPGLPGVAPPSGCGYRPNFSWYLRSLCPTYLCSNCNLLSLDSDSVQHMLK